jgi:hypothetical protein
MGRRLIAFACLAALAGCTLDNGDLEAPFRSSLDGGVRYGHASGFIQIPKGGEAGTTDKQRPTFREVGITEALEEQANLSIGSANPYAPSPGVGAGFSLLQLAGDRTLDSPLLSHGQQFNAGDHVDALLELNWYHVAAEIMVPSRPSEQTPFAIKPSIGFAFLQSAYTLEAKLTNTTARRSFSTGAPYLALEGVWYTTSPLSFHYHVATTVPFDGLPWVFSTGFRAQLRLIGNADKGVFLFAGVGFDRFEVNDEQRPVSNHIRAILGPLFLGGVQLGI